MLHAHWFTLSWVKQFWARKKLVDNPATAEIWQTAFGKDFGWMAQGNNKMGQKGMNAMFVITHDEIEHMLQQEKKFTYGNPFVDYRPQKEDPHWIRITAVGNLVTYKSSPSVHTADLNTANLHWNSVISTLRAKHVPRHQDFLLDSMATILWVHAHAPCSLPHLDPRAT